MVALRYRCDRVDGYTEQQRTAIQTGHLANTNRLVELDKMIFSGTFFGNEELRGLFFFAVNSLEGAENSTASDPAIKAGVLRMEQKERYGSAALMLMRDIIAKSSFLTEVISIYSDQRARQFPRRRVNEFKTMRRTIYQSGVLKL